MMKKIKKSVIVRAEYNLCGYRVFVNDKEVYSAGNGAEDSQSEGTPLPLSIIRKYAVQTAKDIALEHGGVFDGVERVEFLYR